MNDLHDDVKAAFESASADDPGATPGGAPASEVMPPVTAMPPDTTGGRDEHGRFKKTPAEPATPAKNDAPAATATRQAETVAPVSGVPTTPQPPAALGGEPAVKLDPSKPPSAWTPAMKEKWNTIPQPIREEITRREEATAAGIQKLQQQYAPAEELMENVAKYGDYFQHIQANPIEYLDSVIQSEQTLRLGNPAQKLELLLNLGDQYGVPLRSAVNQALNGKLNETLQAAHKQHQTPQALPPEVIRELTEMRQWRNNMETTAARTELDAFATDHPLLDQVKEQMAVLIERGAVETYEDAYNVAVYQNPQLRAQAMAQANGQRQASGIQQRQQAAAGLVAPGSAPLDTGGDGVGDTDDVHEAVRRAWTQASGRA